ncbi:MAG: hypothetical protein ACOYOS_10625 [Syntrophales bacterium]
MYYPTPEEFAHDIEWAKEMIARHESDLRQLRDGWGRSSNHILGEEYIKELHLTIHKLEESLATLSGLCGELKKLYRESYGIEYGSDQNRGPTFH